MSTPPARPLPLSPASLALALGLASAALLAGAWFFELVIGLKPCKLCLVGRQPHYAALPVALAGFAGGRFGLRGLVAAALAALTLLYLWSIGVSVYHSGVEWGWFAGPNDCGGAPAPAASSMADFRKQLETTRVVSCSEAAWRLFGLSLAGWNGLASASLAMLAALGLREALRR